MARRGTDGRDRAEAAGAQLLPSLVPMLKTGSSPGNSLGMAERIEWQS
jgi:hypothetical protein